MASGVRFGARFCCRAYASSFCYSRASGININTSKYLWRCPTACVTGTLEVMCVKSNFSILEFDSSSINFKYFWCRIESRIVYNKLIPVTKVLCEFFWRRSFKYSWTSFLQICFWSADFFSELYTSYIALKVSNKRFYADEKSSRASGVLKFSQVSFKLPSCTFVFQCFWIPRVHTYAKRASHV